LKTFRFLKGPFERIVDPYQFDEMRPGTKNKFDNRFPVRKRKFVAPATRTLALVASELAQPVIEHQEVDQARCRNPWYSGDFKYSTL